MSKTARWLVPLLLLFSLCLNAILLFKDRSDAVVSRVFDGDSFELADGKRVRLLGVDAPEEKHCLGKEAKERLTALILGKHVRLKNVLTDDYGRLVSIVIVEEFDSWLKYLAGKIKISPFSDPLVNRVMVREGMAKNLSVKSEYQKTIDEVSSVAKSSQLGIYSNLCRQTANRDCPIKGNIRDSKKTYYSAYCPNYNQVIVDLSFGDQWFCTEKEARAAGFTISPNCQ